MCAVLNFRGGTRHRYATVNELVNTAPLTSVDVTSSISGLAVYNQAGRANLARGPGLLACSLSELSDAAVADATGCVLTLSAHHTSGAVALRFFTE